MVKKIGQWQWSSYRATIGDAVWDSRDITLNYHHPPRYLTCKKNPQNLILTLPIMLMPNLPKKRTKLMPTHTQIGQFHNHKNIVIPKIQHNFHFFWKIISFVNFVSGTGCTPSFLPRRSLIESFKKSYQLRIAMHVIIFMIFLY